MMCSKYLSAILILSFLSFSCLPEDAPFIPQEPLEYRAIANVSYGGHARQVYDIYLPKNRTAETKIMVLIHGGGWNSGNKGDMNGFRDFMRDQFPELAVVNMHYRLADENQSPYPLQTNDITAVINDLRNKKEEYQIGEELGFLGASAGGHLSLLWSYAKDGRNQVKMVCSIVGPTDLLDEAYLSTQNQELKQLLAQFGNDPDALMEASPLYQVKSDSPPTILFYGGQDPLIPNSQGSSLNERLRELGVPREFHFYPYEAHGWIGLNLLDSSLKLKAFIEKHL